MIEQDLINKALQELEAETERKLIEEYKVKLRERARRTFWQKIFPWKITITRRKP